MMSENAVTRQGHSSLPLQVLVFLNWHFTAFFFIINLCLYTFKAVVYYYPPRYLGLDLVLIFLYLFVDYTRLLLASKGNKTSQMNPMAGSLILSMPLIVLHVYYITLQTYVLRVDVVINAFALFFIGAETILGLIAFLIFLSASKKF
mmetsp:Transcript_26199/g.25040  ORF Transcript_26199/g.25040 Transcript_26199/m.25040 type:complete len:147 (-) Transcript_26199:97-537(-)